MTNHTEFVARQLEMKDRTETRRKYNRTEMHGCVGSSFREGRASTVENGWRCWWRTKRNCRDLLLRAHFERPFVERADDQRAEVL